jgi:hypothetical protein
MLGNDLDQMRRALRLILGLLLIAGGIVASVVWLRDHEADNRSPYEKVFGDEPFAPPLTADCFPRRPGAGRIRDLNKNPESDDAIVPGEPERLLLCRYRGMNYGGRSLLLAKRKLVADPATVRLSADGLNNLPPFPNDEFACPSDQGARTYAFFLYADDPPVIVELRFEGCPAATNGRAGVALLRDPVAEQLTDLVPLPSAS